MTEPSEARRAFWRGHGLWRFPNFFRSVFVDAPSIGPLTAARLHYRRLTVHLAAKHLPRITGRRIGDPTAVYFLSGQEHWHMTAFCAYSLLLSTDANLVPTVLDDGTLGLAERVQLSRIIPQIRYLERGLCESRILQHLPLARFPSLHAMRAELPLMRKLIDLHVGLDGWRLFLDSDVLFFREPEWMLNWLRAPDAAIYMRDYQNSYGYSNALLETTLGKPMPPMVNSGFYGLKSNSIDWEQLEHWARELHRAEGTNHFSEQCLIAMLIAAQAGIAAPPDYKIRPTQSESRSPSVVMHHYVAESRTWYHVYGWPQLLRQTKLSVDE